MEVQSDLTLKKTELSSFLPELFYVLYQTIKIGKNNHIYVQLCVTNVWIFF